jgi:hypothetical protein
MSDKGYIYFWRNSDVVGKIRICNGNFSGLNVGFSLEDCDASLQSRLQASNINGVRVCPPPNGSLCITCSFGVSSSGNYVATNISETTC